MTKKIKLKASKPMADYLNRSCPYDVRLIKMTDDDYRWYVDTAVLTHIEDYSSKTGLFSVIKVIYPDNYYAAPKYFTTRDLLEMYTSEPSAPFCEVFSDYVMI